MDYNKLKTFVIVAETGSITAAAARVHRTQSAVTQQIQFLEDELELKLFERKNARIYLSKDGERIFEMAKLKLGEIDDAVFDIREKLESAEGLIRLGVLNDYGNEFRIGQFLGKFCQRYPKVKFYLVEAPSRELEQLMLANEIDMAFSVFFSHPEMFIQKPLGKTFHSIYATPEYQKTHSIRDYKQILEETIIDLTDNFACFATWYRKNCKKLLPSLLHRTPDIVAPNFLVVKELVLSGIGMGILPDYLVAEEFKTKKLVKLMKTDKQIFAGIDVAYRTNKTLRLCEKLVVDFALEHGCY